jgi:hypothetical protein
MTTTKPKSSNKFGARVFLMDPKVVLVMQTIRRGAGYTDRYIVDTKPTGIVQRSVDIMNDKAIADAIRAALQGTL